MPRSSSTSLPQIPTARERISTSSGLIDGFSSSVTTASPGPLRSRAFIDVPPFGLISPPLADIPCLSYGVPDLYSRLATYDERIKTIHNDSFRDGPASE